MFWELATIQQLMRLATRSKPERNQTHTGATRGTGDRFGCCPRCQGFVRIGPASVVGEPADCPNCHHPITELEALWLDESEPR